MKYQRFQYPAPELPSPQWHIYISKNEISFSWRYKHGLKDYQLTW